MAANTGVIEGQDLLLYVNGTAVAHSSTCVLTPSVEIRDRLTKDSGKFKSKVGGLIDWEVSAEALAAYTGHSYHTLFALLVARAAITIKFAGRPAGENWKTEQVDDYYFEGSAIITGMPMTAPNNADATFSITLSGTGALEQKQVEA